MRDSDRLSVFRYLPDRKYAIVSPFHVSLEGLRTELICRDDEDYDIMVKNIFLAARRSNVIVIIYAVVSNHAHIAVLADETDAVVKFGNDLKKVQSMWLRRKYKRSKVLLERNVDISKINSLSYARNALAYIVRNAVDNGASNIAEYKWSGYRGMFSKGTVREMGICVKDLGVRKRAKLLHSGDNLQDVPWILNKNGEIEPASACDWQYLESIFNHDQAFFIRTIGCVNTADMRYRLEEARKTRLTDEEFLKMANNLSAKWFGNEINSLSMEYRARLLFYLTRTVRSSVPQIARCLNMERELVTRLIDRQ